MTGAPGAALATAGRLSAGAVPSAAGADAGVAVVLGEAAAFLLSLIRRASSWMCCASLAVDE